MREGVREGVREKEKKKSDLGWRFKYFAVDGSKVK